jgi:hypothetical protein
VPGWHFSVQSHETLTKSLQAFCAGAGSAMSRTSQFDGGDEQLAAESASAQRFASASDLHAMALT